MAERGLWTCEVGPADRTSWPPCLWSGQSLLLHCEGHVPIGLPLRVSDTLLIRTRDVHGSGRPLWSLIRWRSPGLRPRAGCPASPEVGEEGTTALVVAQETPLSWFCEHRTQGSWSPSRRVRSTSLTLALRAWRAGFPVPRPSCPLKPYAGGFFKTVGNIWPAGQLIRSGPATPTAGGTRNPVNLGGFFIATSIYIRWIIIIMM